jgi:hypothetical protein
LYFILTKQKKCRSFVGEPIHYEEGRSVEKLVNLTKQSLDNLIYKNQRLPGSVPFALLERFQRFEYKNVEKKDKSQ